MPASASRSSSFHPACFLFLRGDPSSFCFLFFGFGAGLLLPAMFFILRVELSRELEFESTQLSKSYASGRLRFYFLAAAGIQWGTVQIDFCTLKCSA